MIATHANPVKTIIASLYVMLESRFQCLVFFPSKYLMHVFHNDQKKLICSCAGLHYLDTPVIQLLWMQNFGTVWVIYQLGIAFVGSSHW